MIVTFFERTHCEISRNFPAAAFLLYMTVDDQNAQSDN